MSTLIVKSLRSSAAWSAAGRIRISLRGRLSKLRPFSRDILIGAVLAGFGFVGCYRIAQQLDPILFEYGVSGTGGVLLNTQNLWFDGDPAKIVLMSEDRYAAKPLFTVKHPLYRSAAYALVYPLKRLGTERAARIWILPALVASAWSVLIFALLRLITGRHFDAVLLCLLALTSASAMFWLVVPEVYSWGSATIVTALCLAAVRNDRIASSAQYVIVSALTLSITVTNWMVGILVTFAKQAWRRALQSTVNAFVMVCVFWGVQKLFIPSSEFFLAFTLDPLDRAFVWHPDARGPIAVLGSFLCHTMVMPAIHVQSTGAPLWYGMTTQASSPGSGTPWGVIAVAVWMALLAIGVYGIVTVREHIVLRTTVAVAVILQLTLHLVYGRETFLYSLHYLPLLLAVVAIGALTRFRGVTLSLVGVLILVGGINNWLLLTRAITIVKRVGFVADSLGANP